MGKGHGILFSSCPSVCQSVASWFLSGGIKQALLIDFSCFNREVVKMQY